MLVNLLIILKYNPLTQKIHMLLSSVVNTVYVSGPIYLVTFYV